MNRTQRILFFLASLLMLMGGGMMAVTGLNRQLDLNTPFMRWLVAIAGLIFLFAGIWLMLTHWFDGFAETKRHHRAAATRDASTKNGLCLPPNS